MNDIGFDALTRMLGRRGLLRAALTLAGTGTIAAGWHEASAQAEICQEKPKGSRCKRGGECCSGRCKRKKGKKRGKCLCSQLRAPCASDGDCCLPAVSNEPAPICDHIGMGTERVCCSYPPGPCQFPEDCCGNGACNDGHCAGG